MAFTSGENDNFKDLSGVTNAGDKIAAAANDSRRFLFMQNRSDTDMEVNFGVAAGGTGSILIPSGESYTFSPENFVSTSAFHIYCAIAGKVYTLKEGSI